MKKIILVANRVFEYIVIGVIHLPFVALYIMLAPMIFISWLIGRWQKIVKWAEN